jgi:hypothetical protein
MARSWLLAITAAGLLLLPGLARAAAITSITAYSDPTDSVGQGKQRLFTPANSTIETHTNSGGVNVSVSGNAAGSGDFSMSFGGPLDKGVYPDGGVYITGNGTACDENPGRMEVKDVARNASGNVQRLWVVFEQHCQGDPNALWGEVRVAEPVPDGPATTAPAIARWPPLENGATGTVVPVTLLASGATHVSSVTVKGANPGDFRTSADGCTGKSLSGGGSCAVSVQFAPTTPGTRRATLDIADSAGRHYTTALDGFSYGGVTKAVLHSDPGDYIGGGGDATYTPAASEIYAQFFTRYVHFGVDYGDLNGWFVPPKGGTLAPGTYENVKRYPFNGDAAGLAVDTGGRSCNTVTGHFTITTITFDSHGALRTFGATFEQHCDGAEPALHGELDLRAGDTTTLAPWMGGEAAPPANGEPPSGGDPPAGSPPPPGSVPAVSLAAKRREITYGSSTTLRGASTPGSAVDLEAAPFPYTAYSKVASAVAAPDGSFSFRVKPDRNTRYRVAAQGVTSDVHPVLVDLAGSLRRHRLARHRYRVVLALHGPADLPSAGRHIRLYRRGTRIGTARLREVSSGRLRASALTRHPPVKACLPHRAGDAWGGRHATCWSLSGR